MKPTMKLRQVQRGWKNTIISTNTLNSACDREPVYVLQQWWENDYVPACAYYKGEWRDIPIEAEE